MNSFFSGKELFLLNFNCPVEMFKFSLCVQASEEYTLRNEKWQSFLKNSDVKQRIEESCCSGKMREVSRKSQITLQ